MSEQPKKPITAYTYNELENEKEAFSSAEIAAELEKRRRDARLAGYKGELIHPDSAHAEVEANTNGHYVYLHTTVLKQETRIEELEAQLARSQKALKLARDWARGDKWRTDPEHSEDWKWYVAELDAAIQEQGK